MLADAHTHIHEADFPAEKLGGIGVVLSRAADAGVLRMLLVGTSVESSRAAIEFAQEWNGFREIELRVAVGIHPHEADPKLNKDLPMEAREIEKLLKIRENFVVAIGEIGLDYFYDFEFRDRQIELLRTQLELAKKFNKPVNFHTRDPKNATEIRAKNCDFTSVWNDFWPIYDEFFEADFDRNILHSYTEQDRENLEKALARNLNFGVNGISTFAKNDEKDLWRELPLENIVLETDAPFLAPSGFRGEINQPARIREIAENLAKLREANFSEIAKITSENTQKIYFS